MIKGGGGEGRTESLSRMAPRYGLQVNIERAGRGTPRSGAIHEVSEGLHVIK